jgi:hypothetical protein
MSKEWKQFLALLAVVIVLGLIAAYLLLRYGLPLVTTGE